MPLANLLELIKYNENFLNINLNYQNSTREGKIKVQIAERKSNRAIK